MKITILNGSPRKFGNGAAFIEKMKTQLKAFPEVEVQVINLSEQKIEMCIGCHVCYEKGESFCPLKDDAISISKVIYDSDGVIFYSPTYVANMSGLMKNFTDRLSYICHRPAFYTKTALIFTTSGSGGGTTAVKSMKWPVMAWGFRIVKSFEIKMARYRYDTRYKTTIDNNIDKVIREFVDKTRCKATAKPGLIELVSFAIRKRNYLTNKNVYKYDVEYWGEKGWLDKDVKYFFPAEIGMLKRIISLLLTQIIKRIM